MQSTCSIFNRSTAFEQTAREFCRGLHLALVFCCPHQFLMQGLKLSLGGTRIWRRRGTVLVFLHTSFLYTRMNDSISVINKHKAPPRSTIVLYWYPVLPEIRVHFCTRYILSHSLHIARIRHLPEADSLSVSLFNPLCG